MKIVFFGTSSFAAQILSFLIQHRLNIVAVVTRPDRPQGRSLKTASPAVKEVARTEIPQIPVFQPEKASTVELADKLRSLNPDLFLVVAYGEIIKTILLSIPIKGSINIHASLLPKYRGAAPIQRALMNGEVETGVTIIEMVLEMDAGDILAVAKTSIPPEMTFGELEIQLRQISGPLVLDVIQKIDKGNVTRQPQNPLEVTFASKLLPQEEKINWLDSAKKIHNQIRALSPTPGAWSYVQCGKEKKRIKIKRSEPVEASSGVPGESLLCERREWIVACGKGALKLLEVQLEGKKTLLVDEFLRGIQNPPQILV